MNTTEPPPEDRSAWAASAAWLGPAAQPPVPLQAAGFSGADLFVVRCRGERFVLKSFAPGTSLRRAAWVHGLMRHLTRSGVAVVPALRATPTGDTLVAGADGRMWELAEFVAGGPTATPSAAQAAAAAAALARLHLAAATFPAEAEPHRPGLVHRIERAARLLADPWETLRAGLRPAWPSDAVAGRMRRPLDRAIASFAASDGRRALARLAGLRPPALAVQPVLRDVWADHVIFAPVEAARVAAVVDYHAAGIDSPSTDVARLLGSWQPPGGGDGRFLDAWAGTLDAYEQVRPLTRHERLAVPVLAAAAVTFGLDNWFRWVFEEGRTFAAVEPVLARVDWLLARLPQALETLAKVRADGELGPV